MMYIIKTVDRRYHKTLQEQQVVDFQLKEFGSGKEDIIKSVDSSANTIVSSRC